MRDREVWASVRTCQVFAAVVVTVVSFRARYRVSRDGADFGAVKITSYRTTLIGPPTSQLVFCEISWEEGNCNFETHY